jgi:hypothetical protein
MKTKQTSPIPTTIDEQESLPNHGTNFYEILFFILILYQIVKMKMN